MSKKSVDFSTVELVIGIVKKGVERVDSAQKALPVQKQQVNGPCSPVEKIFFDEHIISYCVKYGKYSKLSVAYHLMWVYYGVKPALGEYLVPLVGMVNGTKAAPVTLYNRKLVNAAVAEVWVDVADQICKAVVTNEMALRDTHPIPPSE